MAEPRVYRRVARLYDFLDLPFEHGRYKPLRQQLCAGLSGRILDAGAGTGSNFPFYPPDADVFGIDLSPAMLARALKRRARMGANIPLALMDARTTGFPDDSFDAVVSAFLFCVLDDASQMPALRELGRILKPDSELRILEYAYSRSRFRRFIMRLWAPWVYWLYGARFDRETERFAPAAGLRVAETRWLYRDIIKLVIFKRSGADDGDVTGPRPFTDRGTIPPSPARPRPGR